MADANYTTATLTANISEAASINPVSVFGEIPMVFDGKFSVVVNEGYSIDNYKINSTIYTVEQMKTLVLNESNSTGYNPQTSEYTHEITVNLVSVNPNELKYLSFKGLKYLFEKIKIAGINKLGLVKTASGGSVSIDSSGTINVNPLKVGIRSSTGFHIYVGPLGDDNNQGTIDSPYKTIARALSDIRLITGGVTIYLEPGEYSEGTLYLNGCYPAGEKQYTSGWIRIYAKDATNKPVLKDTDISFRDVHTKVELMNIKFDNSLNKKTMYLFRTDYIDFSNCEFKSLEFTGGVISFEFVNRAYFNACKWECKYMFYWSTFGLQSLYLTNNTGTAMRISEFNGNGLLVCQTNNTITFSQVSGYLTGGSVDAPALLKNMYVIEKNGSTADIPLNSIIFEKE
ncbi:DUF1565 domain-containing protein [Anaerorhabdus sp.]|uniref:DUF1565 domain-containing protein n=1 Tax=Anaerorhabdus sp. TaxID=1872524 RepID=UPI002FC84DE3